MKTFFTHHKVSKVNTITHFEESEEDVRLWVGKEEKGEEGAGAPIQDGGPDHAQRVPGSVVARPGYRHEGVAWEK